LLAIWQEFHGPLVAFAVSLGLALVARFARSPLAGSVAGGAAVAVGWAVTTAVPWVLMPRPLADRLPLLAVGVLVLAVAAGRFAGRRGIWPPSVVVALASGWWLAGAPHTHPALLAAWPLGLGVAVAVVAVAWLSGGTDPLQPVLASVVLAAALHVVAAPWLWVLLALVPGAAALPLLAAPGLSAMALLPLAADVAASGAGVVITAGRLARGGFTAVDAAALSPLLALWLAPRIGARLGAARRLGPLLGAIIAGALSVAVAWGVMRFRNR
jgi:hypothetical protein